MLLLLTAADIRKRRILVPAFPPPDACHTEEHQKHHAAQNATQDRYHWGRRGLAIPSWSSSYSWRYSTAARPKAPILVARPDSEPREGDWVLHRTVRSGDVEVVRAVRRVLYVDTCLEFEEPFCCAAGAA